MTLPQFTLTILLLLCTPGPTNTLMALGGFSRGWARALPLVAGELGGYLTVIVPVTTVAAPFFTAYPQASLIAKAAAAIWVLWLSYGLWNAEKKSGRGVEISLRQVFLTTLLNPKALIIALVIMPHGAPLELLPWLGLFAGLVILAANGWILFGRMLGRTERFAIKPVLMRRVAAACLLVFAMILTTTSIQSLA